MSAWENYRLEWSADPLSVTIPTWQDITSSALAPFGSPISITGGVPTMGSAAQPTVMSVSLDNHDHRFTFGNTSSPLSPNWKPGRRIRCYETIAGKRFDLFSGFIQPPETDDWADSGIDQYMTVTAIDRLGRIGTGRQFISTLAEYIQYASPATLLAYYPLGDNPGPLYKPLINVNNVYTSLSETVITAALSGASQSNNGYAAAAAGPLPGDDLTLAKFAPSMVQSGVPFIAAAQTWLVAQMAGLGGPIATNATMTIALWVIPDAASVDAQWAPIRIGFNWNGGAGTGTLTIRRTDSTETPAGVWKCSFNDDSASWTSVAFGSPPLSDSTATDATLIACQVNLATSALTLMVNRQQSTGTVTGSFPSTISIAKVTVGDTYTGAIGHIQIHQSSGTSNYTSATQLAQYSAGLTGLLYQTTGQRITTLMQYAGVPTTDLGLIDPGTALMSRALLAGKNPLAAMREAETTEQGRLRTNGQGLPVFDPRTRRYNS